MQTVHHSLNDAEQSARAHDPDKLANTRIDSSPPAERQAKTPYEDEDDCDDEAHGTRGALPASPEPCSLQST